MRQARTLTGRGERLLLALVILLFVIYALCLIIQGTGTFADVLRGYYSLDQWQHGGNFNTLTYKDGCAQSSVFLSWWTPGQYLLPFALMKTVLPRLAEAQNVLILLFLFLALTGYYRLFKVLGFDRRISLLALLLIESHQLFFWQTLLYYGGSLFELGLLPWFLLFLLYIQKKAHWRSVIYLVLPALMLFTFKATFLLHTFTGLLALFLLAGKGKPAFRTALISSGLVVAAGCYFAFLQFGETPSTAFDYGTYDSVPNSAWTDCTNAMASVSGIFTGIAPILHKVLLHETRFNGLSFSLLLLLALATLLLFVKIYRSGNPGARFLVIFTGGFFGMMSLLYLSDKAVSYDLRHFAPLSFCFFPFILRELYKRLPAWSVVIVSGLLISANLTLFTIRRWQFPEKMQAFNGLLYTNREAHILKNLQELRQRQGRERDLYAISDYWLPVMALGNADVIPYRLKNSQIVLCSGMELDHPPALHPDDWFNCHDRIIFILKAGEKLPLPFRKYRAAVNWIENGELRVICLTK